MPGGRHAFSGMYPTAQHGGKSTGKETAMYNAAVLVLNQTFEPLNVCNVRRALVLVLCGKAEVLELNHQIIHSPSISIHAPSVIRLSHLIRRPRPRARLS